METVDKDLEYLVKIQLEKDYTKHNAELPFPKESYKQFVYQAKLDGKPLSKEGKILLYMIGNAFIKVLNETGYHKWLPDFIKDTASKFLLEKLLHNQWLLGAIEMKAKEK